MAGIDLHGRGWRIALPALALLAAACGTTVPQASKRLTQGGQQIAAGGVNEQGGVATDANGNPLPAGSTGAIGGSGGSNAFGTRSGSDAAAGAGAPGSGGSSARAAAGGSGSNVPGVTATTMNIGLLYTTNGQAANAALGAGGVTQGDERANYQILIDDINAHGGVAGRKLVPVFHALDATAADTTDAKFQAACDDLTQDHKVFAVFAGGTETFQQCLQNRGVISVEDNLTTSDTSTYQRFPYYFEIGSMNLDRIAAAEVPALQAQGYFAPWDAAAGKAAAVGKAKVGVITFDLPAFAHAIDQVMVPALTKAGYAPDAADVVKVPPPQQNSDLGATSAAVSGAVLKFRSDGVEHVIPYDANGLMTLLFMTNANSQHYYPRYGTNTQNGNQALADAGALPKEQLVGSMGIGWLPGLDITPAENTDDGPFSNDARRRCLALMKAHGQTYTDANAESIALGACNTFSWFREAMNGGGTNISRDTFLVGANKIASSWQSTSVFGTFFGPNRHDGVNAFRYWAYQDSCSCMHYTSGNIRAD
jgi:hypothetical protein